MQDTTTQKKYIDALIWIRKQDLSDQEIKTEDHAATGTDSK